MKKTILVFILVVVLCGCSKSQDPTTFGISDMKGNTKSTTLTLACWIADNSLRNCVEEFNKNNTNYTLEIHEYYDPTEQDYQTAMTRMQIDLVSDDSFDLFYLNSLDIYALENAGILLDLLPLMETDTTFKKEDYYWNIWSQYCRDGKLYEWIPAFDLTGVIGPSELLSTVKTWSISDYTEFTKDTGQAIGNILPESMICSMLQYTNHKLIDLENGTCNLNSDEFREWMNFQSL